MLSQYWNLSNKPLYSLSLPHSIYLFLGKINSLAVFYTSFIFPRISYSMIKNKVFGWILTFLVYKSERKSIFEAYKIFPLIDFFSKFIFKNKNDAFFSRFLKNNYRMYKVKFSKKHQQIFPIGLRLKKSCYLFIYGISHIFHYHNKTRNKYIYCNLFWGWWKK